MVSELRKYALALRFIKAGDVVVDAGAFIGSYSFLYSRLVGEEGTVFSYEPQPHALRILVEGIEKKQIKNIEVRDRAASHVTGRAVAMKVFSNCAEQCCTVEPSLMDSDRMPGSTAMIDVQTETLDTLDRKVENRHLSFIKIDTEGHEDKVIAGAVGILAKHQPVVVMEYGFVPDRFEPNTIEQIGEMGYTCFDLNNMVKVHPGYVSLEATDLVAVPPKKMEEFQRFFPDLLSLPPLLRLKIFASKVTLKYF